MFQSLFSNLRFLFTLLREHTSRKTSLFLDLPPQLFGCLHGRAILQFYDSAFTALSEGNVDAFPLFKHLSHFIPQTSWNPFFSSLA